MKLYVNASDASTGLREQLAARVGLAAGVAPYVVGVNAAADGESQLKVYQQADDPLELAAGLGEAAQALSRAVLEANLSAGAILSHDVVAVSPMELRARAFFVALRESEPEPLEAALGCLPGWSADACLAEVPFEAASPCFVGIDPARPERWTTYFKPRGSAARFRLHPSAVFRASSSGGDAELAIFVEPDRPDRRAYSRVAGLAISYRVREGEPRRDEVAALLDWVGERIGDAGQDAALEDPPRPWRRVG